MESQYHPSGIFTEGNPDKMIGSRFTFLTNHKWLLCKATVYSAAVKTLAYFPQCNVMFVNKRFYNINIKLFHTNIKKIERKSDIFTMQMWNYWMHILMILQHKYKIIQYKYKKIEQKLGFYNAHVKLLNTQIDFTT